ncbi:cysteine desulfurase family protein [Paenibacillus turpanensis]|uniref:cysteine desulfurase family protein n=1 Tax=Paenibacillus turpanensis TaxID=2689078 RepID=UPI00140D5FAE|nr:cysteine desulfurase family protein [Paenibacillus turpanensis]
MIYFDNAATTPLDPEVKEAMLPFLHHYGNPSSKYYTAAEEAKEAVQVARSSVADLLGCEPEEVIFTSGSTESNNMIIKGVADTHWGTGKRFITSSMEHSSVLEVASYLTTKGLQVDLLKVDNKGVVPPELLSATLDRNAKDTFLVSLMWGNNEIATLNDIIPLGNLCKQRNIPFHTDATQVVGKVPIHLKDLPVQYLSLSSHKIHGPKGIGAAVLRKDELGIRPPLTPLIHGGGQEFNLRSGTLNVPGIVGFGKAAEIAKRDLESTQRQILALESYATHKIKEHFSSIVSFNSPSGEKLPGIINIRFKGIHNELLIKKLSPYVALSSGSACSSSKPSHVLQSIGCSLDEVRSSIRISLSKFNTIEEIDQFIAILRG